VRDLKGKVIILTGASSGIGRATALALARHGAVLHLVARREALLEQVCADARARGGSATPHVFDVRDPDAFARMVEQITAQHSRVDVLINNAGVGAMKSFLETTDDDWKWTVDTNLHSVINSIRAVLPGMLERGEGTIVNVASLAGLMANTLAAYSASKAAVIGLSESLVLEYGDRGIDIVVVCPGIIDTDIANAGILAGRAAESVGQNLQKVLSTHGARPEAVARDIVAAIRRPRFLILSPAHATVLRTLHSMFPGLTRSLVRRLS